MTSSGSTLRGSGRPREQALGEAKLIHGREVGAGEKSLEEVFYHLAQQGAHGDIAGARLGLGPLAERAVALLNAAYADLARLEVDRDQSSRAARRGACRRGTGRCQT
jgi:hypothetical protein